jgi:hypothetical protein
MMGPHTEHPTDFCVRNIFGFHTDAGGERDHKRRAKRQVTSAARTVLRRTTPEHQT